MAAKAKELKAAGKTVYDLSVGEPDFITPAHICQAAGEAMRAGHTKYTLASGIAELRQAVVEQYRARHGLKYSPAQVVVANGAKHALHNAFTVLLDPGDEVIIPAPYWVSYAELVKLTGAMPVIVETRRGGQFQAHARDVSPGRHPEDEAAALVQPVEPDRQHVLAGGAGRSWPTWFWSRTCWWWPTKFTSGWSTAAHRFASFATVRPGLQPRTILVNGVSKTYAMTGWRIGWTLAPRARLQGDGRLAEPGDLESVQHQPVRRAGRPEGPAGLRDRDVGRVCQATRVRHASVSPPFRA